MRGSTVNTVMCVETDAYAYLRDPTKIPFFGREWSAAGQFPRGAAGLTVKQNNNLDEC